LGCFCLPSFFLVSSFRRPASTLRILNMSVCPVCDQRVPGGDDAVARHVNAHFDEGGNDNINDNEAEGFSITGGTNM
jgi:hypothetical protein